MQGVGFDRAVLEKARVAEADAVAAVTSGDNSNIVIARVAREAFGVERVVARIYDTERAQIVERMGIPTVATVEWSTERVLRRHPAQRGVAGVGRPVRHGADDRDPRLRRDGPDAASSSSRTRAALGSRR